MSLDSLRGRATVTVEEAARCLGISRSSGYAAVKRGELPALTLGRRRLVPVPQLLRLLGDEVQVQPLETSQKESGK